MTDVWVNNVNLNDVTDELSLHELLDRTEDYEDRKKVRSRLKDVIAQNRASRDEAMRRREEERENLIKQRVKDADEAKARMLKMYDVMAKAGPAASSRNIDIKAILKGEDPANAIVDDAPKLDLVEEGIRARQKESDDRKQRVLAAYDIAAKSAPAGTIRHVDFDKVKDIDLDSLQLNRPNVSAAFEMRGGIPVAAPVVPLRAEHDGPLERDILEEGIRKRQFESDEKKRRTLEAYDRAQKSRPAGTPVTVYVPSTEGVDPVVDIVEPPGSRAPGTPRLTPKLPPRIISPVPQEDSRTASPLQRPITPQQRPVSPQQRPVSPQQPLKQQQQQQWNRPQAQQQQWNKPQPQQNYLQQNQQYKNVANFKPVAPQPPAKPVQKPQPPAPAPKPQPAPVQKPQPPAPAPKPQPAPVQKPQPPAPAPKPQPPAPVQKPQPPAPAPPPPPPPKPAAPPAPAKSTAQVTVNNSNTQVRQQDEIHRSNSQTTFTRRTYVEEEEEEEYEEEEEEYEEDED